eukprot:3396738-Alexandrium_andersonii.AAC.1
MCIRDRLHSCTWEARIVARPPPGEVKRAAAIRAVVPCTLWVSVADAVAHRAHRCAKVLVRAGVHVSREAWAVEGVSFNSAVQTLWR